MSFFVRRLARPLPRLPEGSLPAGRVAYLDIETTGLAAAFAQVTLVGIAWGDGRERVLEQHFVDAPDREATVLGRVARLLRGFAGAVTYNGGTFDLPFLRHRARMLGVRWPWVEQLDLLRAARRWRRSHGRLPNCCLGTVLAHFGVQRVDETSGVDMVNAYRRWLRTGNPAHRSLILDHNADDVLLLPDLVPHLLG